MFFCLTLFIKYLHIKANRLTFAHKKKQENRLKAFSCLNKFKIYE